MGWISWLFSDSLKTETPGLFSNSPELDCETDFRTVHAYSSVCIVIMNNMIGCKYSVNVCSNDVLAWTV